MSAPHTSHASPPARFRQSAGHQLTMVLVGFVMAMTAPIELLYAIKLGLSPVLVTVFIVSSAAGLMLVDVLGTRVVTRIDARSTAVVGMVLFAVSEACYGLADRAPELIAARVLQGLASAVVAGAALQVTVRMRARPHRALGSNASLQMLGGSVGAPVGGLLATQSAGIDGYRLAFAVCCGAGLAAGALVVLLLPRLPAPYELGRPRVGLPRLAVGRAVRVALALGLIGNYLRSGIENTAFPLIGDAASLTPAGIGISLGVLSMVEIVVLGTSGTLFEKVRPAHALVWALALGVIALGALLVAHSLSGFLTAAVLFGLVDGVALAAPPVLVVATSPDPSIAVANYRIACGVGSFSGSGSVNLLFGALGTTGCVIGGGLVLLSAAVLAGSRPLRETHAARAQ
ncbi:MFS transporter [Streptomyces sp. NPDC006602]|uniref:MFS transporter n=1 Tax=Streptomyces sp. NPDC006602 TaxID=3364751 RepID=UPI00368D91FF